MRALRAVVGVTGEVLVTVGVLLLLFVVWQLGFVAVVEGKRQAGVVEALERDFVRGVPARAAADTSNPAFANGELFAIVRIPRLGGPQWAKPVFEGVGLDVLAKGLGHYPQTQLPGDVGNVAIAGHRAGHGNPLIDIDAIRPGDVMIIETRAGYYVYRADRFEIVQPTDVGVIAPVPQQPGAQPTERWFTLTTCNPRYGSTQRYIVFAKLDRVIPRSDGLPRDLLADPAQAA